MNIFEQATRQKVRFDTPKGQLTIEDLWDLPLTSTSGRANLDEIARQLFRKVKETEEVSFVTPAPSKDKSLTQMKFDLVKRVIEVRLAERDAAAEAEKNRQRKQLVASIIEQKENAALQETSLEELRKMMES